MIRRDDYDTHEEFEWANAVEWRRLELLTHQDTTPERTPVSDTSFIHNEPVALGAAVAAVLVSSVGAVCLAANVPADLAEALSIVASNVGAVLSILIARNRVTPVA